MIDFNNIKQEIINLLNNQKLDKVLIFGSYAHGKVHDDSDIDLLVILDKKGICQNYKEMILNKQIVSKQLRKLRKKVPIDLLVYTVDEWMMLRNTESSFVKQIENEGIRII